MGELTIRRNRGFAVPRYQGMGKAEKSAGSSGSQKVERTTVTVSETLKQLLTRVSQAAGEPADAPGGRGCAGRGAGYVGAHRGAG